MIINPYIFGGFDPDAQAFITAAGITDTTQQNAINTLVVDLKGYGIWSKMKAIYPFVGGTATSHSYNLINPAQYQITWFGGVTHNSNGITGNGTNGYGNTGLPNNIMAQTSKSLSVYSRTDANNFGIDISYGTVVTNGVSIQTGVQNNLRIWEDNLFRQISTSNSFGLHSYIRNNSTQITLQKNNTLSSQALNTGVLISNNIFILTSSIYYSTRNLAFSSIGDGLSNTEALDLYTAVQAYQTSLSRQV